MDRMLKSLYHYSVYISYYKEEKSKNGFGFPWLKNKIKSILRFCFNKEIMNWNSCCWSMYCQKMANINIAHVGFHNLSCNIIAFFLYVNFLWVWSDKIIIITIRHFAKNRWLRQSLCLQVHVWLNSYTV